MAGHSKWSNIKVRKGAVDAKKSISFTRIAKEIVSAIKVGGSSDANKNPKLRKVIEKAKEVNMPKENIDRLIAKFEERRANLETVVFEGTGSAGALLMVVAETDNKNRTLTDVRVIFRDNLAALGSAGSASFMFDKVGFLEASLEAGVALELVESGLLDYNEKVVYCQPEKIHSLKQKMEEKGIEVGGVYIGYKPKQKKEGNLADWKLIEELEDQEDVLMVYHDLL